ncbi:MAG: hypothetical protein KIH63_003375 [Candidatus Saccharibacteria bacterium]|nr:hypothetical protein [Candidatus Saccharibacteria bacterium]
MNTRGLSYAGGLAAITLAASALALSANGGGEHEPTFDPTQPATISSTLVRQVTAPELIASRSEPYVLLEQCTTATEAGCVTADYPRGVVERAAGTIVIGDSVVIESDD